MGKQSFLLFAIECGDAITTRWSGTSSWKESAGRLPPVSRVGVGLLVNFLGGTPQEHTFVPEEKSQTQCPRHKIHINIHVDIYR